MAPSGERKQMDRSRTVAIALLLTIASAHGAPTQSGEEFYRGKTISMIIPIGPGGAYDAYARLVSRYLGKYLPGNPSIVARNMPGAGGVIASNYLYNVAPQDGTTLEIITSSFATQQVIGDPQIKYDARQLPAIGRLLDTTSVQFFWHTSPIKTLDDLRTEPCTVALSTLTEVSAVRTRAMNRYLGMQMKIVSGYLSARDYVLAVQRGETDGGSSTYIGLSQLFAADLRDKNLNILVQFAAARDPAMPDVPTVLELTQDQEAHQVFSFLDSNDEIGRSLFTTPNVPADRVASLRTAFDKMLLDPDFLAEAKRLYLPLATKSGEELQKIVAGTFDIPPAALAKVLELSQPKSE
jgi:tripartite-type tricarboxylate transporter receptor subunit TctC